MYENRLNHEDLTYFVILLHRCLCNFQVTIKRNIKNRQDEKTFWLFDSRGFSACYTRSVCSAWIVAGIWPLQTTRAC